MTLADLTIEDFSRIQKPRLTHEASQSRTPIFCTLSTLEYIALPNYDTRMPLKQRPRYILIGAAVGGTIGAILAPIIAPAILGFGATGPVPGGIASKIQSSMGNVPPGSLFSRLQSMAMGGPIGPAILVYIIPGAAMVGIVGAPAGLLVYLIVNRSHLKSDRVDDS